MDEKSEWNNQGTVNGCPRAEEPRSPLPDECPGGERRQMPGLRAKLISFIGRRGLCQEVTQVGRVQGPGFWVQGKDTRVQEKEMDAYRRLEEVLPETL